MFFYVATIFTATATASKVHDIVCERCGTGFSYELRRAATGHGRAHYCINEKGAMDQAQTQLLKAVQDRLTEEAELVPCPKCRWVNDELVRKYRNAKYRWLPRLALVIVPLGVLTAFFFGYLLRGHMGTASPLPFYLTITLMSISVLSPVWVYGIRALLRRRINPNRTYPGHVSVPIGTPPAIIKSIDPSTGCQTFRVVPSLDPGENPAGWAVFRAGRIEFPKTCWRCGAIEAKPYVAPCTTPKRAFPTHLCRSCASRTRLLWLASVPVVLAVILGLVSLVCLLLPGDDMGLRIGLPAAGGIFLFIFSLAIFPDKMSRPYRLGVIDAARGICKFRAANPALMQLLNEQIARIESRPPVSAPVPPPLPSRPLN